MSFVRANLSMEKLRYVDFGIGAVCVMRLYFELVRH